MNSGMPTGHRIMSIVVDRQWHHRVRAEAAQQGKSVSRFVRDLLAERVRPPRTRRRGHSVLLKLCRLAHGELVGTDVDRELHGDGFVTSRASRSRT